MAIDTNVWQRLPETPISFTSLGFGTAPMGNLYRAIPDAEAQAMLARAWEGGVRYFDTAPLYGLGLSETRLNPFLRYINEYGLQFGYRLIEEPEDVPFNFFYTSNLSLDRQRLLEDPFDEGFPYAAWEDIEVSYRLSQKGQRLVYEKDAVTRHDHPTSLERFMARQEKAAVA